MGSVLFFLQKHMSTLLTLLSRQQRDEAHQTLFRRFLIRFRFLLSDLFFVYIITVGLLFRLISFIKPSCQLSYLSGFVNGSKNRNPRDLVDDKKNYRGWTIHTDKFDYLRLSRTHTLEKNLVVVKTLPWNFGLNRKWIMSRDGTYHNS